MENERNVIVVDVDARGGVVAHPAKQMLARSVQIENLVSVARIMRCCSVCEGQGVATPHYDTDPAAIIRTIKYSLYFSMKRK